MNHFISLCNSEMVNHHALKSSLFLDMTVTLPCLPFSISGIFC